MREIRKGERRALCQIGWNCFINSSSHLPSQWKQWREKFSMSWKVGSRSCCGSLSSFPPNTPIVEYKIKAAWITESLPEGRLPRHAREFAISLWDAEVNLLLQPSTKYPHPCGPWDSPSLDEEFAGDFSRLLSLSAGDARLLSESHNPELIPPVPYNHLHQSPIPLCCGNLLNYLPCPLGCKLHKVKCHVWCPRTLHT